MRIAGRAGLFFRVRQQGTLREGDLLELIQRPHPKWSLLRISQLLYGSDSVLMQYNSRGVRLSEWCGTMKELRELSNIGQLAEIEYREEIWEMMRVHSSREIARDAYDKGLDGAQELKNVQLFKGDRGTIGGYRPIGKYGEALRRRDLLKSWCGAWHSDEWFKRTAWTAAVLILFAIAIFCSDEVFVETTRVSGLDNIFEWPLFGTKLTPEQLSRMPSSQAGMVKKTQRGGGRASFVNRPIRIGANHRGWEAAN